MMEAKDGCVLDFAHQLEHIRNTHPFNGDEELDRDDMKVSAMNEGNYKKYVICLQSLAKTILDTELGSSHALFREKLQDFVDKVIEKTATIFKTPHFCSSHPKGLVVPRRFDLGTLITLISDFK